MSKNWKQHADAAMTDLASAQISLREANVLQHLRDAAENLRLAIEALEDDEG